MFQLSKLTGKPVPPAGGQAPAPAARAAVTDSSATHEVAIIGFAGRIGSASQPAELAELLGGAEDRIGPFPSGRRDDAEPFLRHLGVDPDEAEFFEGAFLDDIASFDPALFRLSPKEAALMNPNQRLFLMAAWQAIEHAGYGGAGLAGSRTGVYVGYNGDALHDYKRMIEALCPEELGSAAPGNLSSMIAGRVAYLLDLHGPALQVDTACSSSLVALHLACQAIRSGECDAAVAGSVKINLLPLDHGVRLGMEAGDGRAKPFDDAADGTGMGDGAVALLLKPLAKAKRDGDFIHGVIKGSAVGQDGSSAGITAPNALAQEDVIARAWQDADVDPETISYIEAHGTGTSLGDPIEIDGLTRAFRRHTDKRQFCAIGSAKSQIGHLDHAAGIAGVLRGLLALKRGMLPPNVHFRRPNRSIDFIGSPLYVNVEPSPWPKGAGPRRMGVSAFGMSGTNAHVVLEEAPARESAAAETEAPALFVLSARSPEGLAASAARMREWLKTDEAAASPLAAMCATAACGRSHGPHRLAIVCRTRRELALALEEALHAGAVPLGEAAALQPGSAAASEAAWTPEGACFRLAARGLAAGSAAYAGRVQPNAAMAQEVDAAEASPSLDAAARLYASGGEPAWTRLHPPGSLKRAPLPGAPFELRRCWLQPSRPAPGAHAAAARRDIPSAVPPEALASALELLPPELRQQLEPLLGRLQRLEDGEEGKPNRARRVRLLEGGGRADSAGFGGMPLQSAEETGTSSTAEPDEALQAAADAWGEVLGYDELSPDAGFYELGGDSILALRAVGLLSKRFGADIAVHELLAAPVLEAFASVLRRKLASASAASREAAAGRVADASPQAEAAEADVAPGFEAGRDEAAEAGVASGFDAGRDADGLAPLIPRTAEQPHYAVSSSQRQMYLQQQAQPDDRSYNLPELLHLSGDVDADRLESAIRSLIRRHEPLRSSFAVVDGEVRQFIHGDVPFGLQRLSCAEDELDGTLRSLSMPFALSRAPQLRAALVSTGPRAQVLFLDLHHIASDGMSAGILLQELLTLYSGGSLPPLPLRYRDYAEWQQRTLASERMDRQRAWWRERLQDEWPVLELPADFARPPVKDGRGATFELDLDAGLSAAVRRHAAASGCTPFVVLLAAYYVLLAKHTGAEDIAVGTPVAGRPSPRLERLAGMFVGTHPLRARPEAAKSFATFVREVKETVLDAFASGEVPFEELVRMEGRRDPSRSPLFDTMFIMQNLRIPDFSQLGLAYRHQRYEHGTSKYDLMVQAVERPHGLRLVVEYAVSLFRERTARSLIDRYVRLIGALLAEPERPLGEADMLSSAEREQLERFGRGPSLELRPARAEALVEAWAAARPDALAVSGKDGSWTYRELNAKADQIARLLRREGTGAGSVVAVLADRTPLMLAAMVGALKSGAAYLPLDPAAPPDRLRYMLEDSGALLALTELPEPAPSREALRDVRELRLAELGQLLAADDAADAAREQGAGRLSAEDPMYVIYTSGSTGRPKGVVVPHRAFHSFAASMSRLLGGIGPEDRCLSLTNLSFDVSVCELFLPLHAGAAAILYPDDSLLDPLRMAQIVAEERITFAYLPPTLLGEVASELERQAERGVEAVLSKLLVGVEPIRSGALERFAALLPGIAIVNGYGPTEAAVCATAHVFRPGGPADAIVPIGRPMHDTEVLLLGYGGKPVPPGVGGELCIAGSHLALGYLGLPELTAERFAPHSLRPDQRLYRTGDLARWLPDGQAMYAGRIDRQLKIRGVRIEPGEVEARLLQLDGVAEAVVDARLGPAGDRVLCAYLVLGRERGMKELRAELLALLPEAMVPAFLLPVPAIPLTRSGKVDRRALPDPSFPSAQSAAEPASLSPSERRLAQLWQEALGLERVGPEDDFFERGGHSLKAAALAGRIRQSFGIEVPLRAVFEHPTLSGMAGWLDAQGASAGESDRAEAILPATRAGARPVLSTAAASDEAGSMPSLMAASQAGSRIPRAADRPHYPMSRAQRRMFLLERLGGGGASYHVPLALLIRGELDAARLEAAFRSVIERHESLRTAFVHEDESFRQLILPQAEFHLEQATLSAEETELLLADSRAPAVKEAVSRRLERLLRPFALDAPPLLRALLLEADASCRVLLLDFHHMAADGLSMPVLVRELLAFYEGKALEPLPIRYRDYALWLEGRLSEPPPARWLERFAGELPPLELPTDRPRPSVRIGEGRRLEFEFDEKTTADIGRFARGQGVTLYTALLGAYMRLLAAYGNVPEVRVGSPAAGRSHPDAERLVGLFVNTLALRGFPAPERRLDAFLQQLQQETLEALEHQDRPFEDLLEALGVQPEEGRLPLFDCMFVLQNMELPELAGGGLTAVMLPLEAGSAKADLTLEAARRDGRLVFQLEYDTALFAEATARRIIRHYAQVWKEWLQPGASALPLEQLGMIDSEERRELLADALRERREGTMEIKEMADPASLPDGAEEAGWVSMMAEFERQARSGPDAPAVHAGEETWSYGELNARANRMAHALRARGVGPEKLVVVMASRTPRLLVALLGVLKAGGAFVAVDPSYPEERIRWMLEDAGSAPALVEAAYLGRAAGASAEWTLEELEEDGAGRSDRDPVPVSRPEHLAYVLYTSGSTGRPKGAMIEHRGLASFLKQFRARFPLAAGQAVLAMAAVSFDIFLVETLLPLTIGMRVVLASEEERGDAASLGRLVERHEVDVLQLTPSRFRWWAAQEGQTAALRRLSVLMIGAEPLAPSLLAKLREATDACIFNLYGPTETTVWTSVQEVTALPSGETITIGTPIGGAHMLVLNNKLKLVPTGVIGEICIGGEGVGRGYLGHPEWNEGAFAEHPLLPGERLYRTGDLGRRLASGQFVYAGRRDHQVKIRGHRVELGEVEQQAQAAPGIREAVVTVVDEEAGDQALCLYAVPESGREDGAEERLQAHLAARLPGYMIPAYRMLLERIPLTPTGKVDRKALPRPEARGAAAFEPPAGELEIRLAALWRDVLTVEAVGRRDGFFELGGHSLKAATLASRIAREFGADVPLRELFQHSTLAAMAELVGRSAARLEPIPRQPDSVRGYPMSPAQRRQYLLQWMAGEATMYHVPFAVDIRGTLDPQRLEQAFGELARRQESLRTTFHYENGEFLQRVHAPSGFRLERSASLEAQAADGLSASGELPVQRLVQAFVRPFSLDREPAVRAALLRLGAERHLLLLDLHHIVTDGVSTALLIRELGALYTGAPLPEPRIGYRDYAVWQLERLQSEAMLAKEAYWLALFEEQPPALELPLDRPRPAAPSFRGATLERRLDRGLTAAAERLAARRGATLFAVLLGAYGLLLSKYAGEEDLVIGTPAAGRTHPDVEPLLGMFVHTVALRLRPAAELGSGAYMRRIQQDLVDALDRQDYPFEQLVERLGIQPEAGRNPLFDTMFILQNMDQPAIRAGELSLEPLAFDPGVSKFDLTLEAVQRDGVTSITFEYAADLFDPDTIERMARHYEEIVRQLCADEDGTRPLEEFELETEEAWG
ncbi:amino acid adenylation domain-containing protein [Paenibacillus albicereus]|uniref:Amino acid adenylation domain-containing protein n=1 Tax=Paenibacillus albicereus TaxID=2726185 RepID=A0A6H2GVG8_9BACL|nr:non-ribosomal peptide synthetase [Paenibacillus albicereus]QJC51349.1 amino acid adenylation domain-containing protein [Paenibacillus albicereus]